MEMNQNEGVTFGVFTDVHYAHRPDDETRFFESSIDKLRLCLEFFRRSRVDFIVCLGDLTDCGRMPGERGAQMKELLTVLRACPVPFYLCFGNHDICALPYRELLETFGTNAPFGYASFNAGGTHFVLLDTNYREDGTYYTARTMQWDRLYLDAPQLEWLERDLKATCFPAVVMTHGNLDFRTVDGHLDPHIIQNHEEVRKVLNESGKVRLVLQGHCHAGACSVQNGIPYVTLKAMVDGRKAIPALIVSRGPANPGNVLRFVNCGSPGYLAQNHHGSSD